jgi:hypothetical protein
LGSDTGWGDDGIEGGTRNFLPALALAATISFSVKLLSLNLGSES